MILETIVVKGLLTAGHWAAAHVSSGMAAKGSLILAKSVGVHGLAATASAVTGGAIATGFVVGGITWTKKLVEEVYVAASCAADGDYPQAIKKFGTLFGKLHGLDIEYFPDVVVNVLEKLGVSEDLAIAIGRFIRNNEEKVLEFSKL